MWNIFISTPCHETFGTTPPQAMACDTPVIGSNAGGIKYLFAHGKTGLLVPLKNSESLVEKIDLLFANKVLVHIMQRTAVKRVNALFTCRQVASRIDETYSKLLSVVVTQAPIIFIFQRRFTQLAISKLATGPSQYRPMITPNPVFYEQSHFSR